MGLHVGIIMDGNGRWARARGMPRVAGHHEGTKAVRRAVEAAPTLGIDALTLYAFSSDNWQRPGPEVRGLMRLLRHFLQGEIERCQANNIRMSVIGRRDRLPFPVRSAVDQAEEATAQGTALHLRVAVDYSARDALVAAATRLRDCCEPTRDDLERAMAEWLHCPGGVRDVDLLIRTGGEQRLSDFLLWECAYAELYFSREMWPDFDAERLATAVREFRSRERRFGRVLEAVAG